MFKVNVAPDMAIYNLLKSQNYQASYALAEFIDNAINAFQQDKKHTKTILKVSVKFYSSNYPDSKKRNSIEIVDDGPGISRDRLKGAFKPAKPPGEKGLSEFGIGMKSAAVWFSDVWVLSTQSISESKKYSVRFDYNELITAGQDEIKVEESKVTNSESGTTILLKDVKRHAGIMEPARYKEICQDITEIYQEFTSKTKQTMTLTAEFDGTPTNLNFPDIENKVLIAPEYRKIKNELYAIGPDQNWKRQVSFIFMGCTVNGFVQLLDKGSYTSNPGIKLLRHRRLITGTTRNPYIPESIFGTANKYGPQRLYGVLHLDGIPVSYTKDCFLFDEDEFLKKIRECDGVAKLLHQASEYRVNTPPKRINSVDEVVVTESGGSKSSNKKTTDSSGDANASSDGSSGGHAGKTGRPSGVGGGKQQTKNTGVNNAVDVLNLLNSSSFALQTVIKESSDQYLAQKYISSALCLRIVLETGLLYKIQQSFSEEYPIVADKAIQSLLKYMNSNSDKFFDRSDHLVKKCVQSNATGSLLDVMLINNVAHGHYHPGKDDLDRLAMNLQPLLIWAFA